MGSSAEWRTFNGRVDGLSQPQQQTELGTGGGGWAGGMVRAVAVFCSVFFSPQLNVSSK